MATRNSRNIKKPQTLHDMQLELAELKRRHGATYRDIARAVGVSKSTAYRWTAHIEFEPPAQRNETDLVPLASGGFSWRYVTTQPPTPPRDRRGRKRTKPHIQDTPHMRMLVMDIRQRLKQNPIKK
jgi:DNA-binding XRE family transcriptional regulator